jgi:beta-lactamase class A
MNLSSNKKNALLLIASFVATNLGTYYFASKTKPAQDKEIEHTDASAYSGTTASCTVKVKRLNGYNFIKPVLFVDRECESDKLFPIKQSVTNLLDEYKRTGDLNSGSIFLKEYTGNDWIAINGEEKYMPGSLMKVPELIAFLKMEESNPGLLNKELMFDRNFPVDKHPKFVSKSIVLGHKYTIRELLRYMIVYSDNNATSLLFSHMDANVFKKVFTDVGLQSPDLTAQNYPISAKDFSIFMRILYNSSYLTNKNSEFATELLSQCNFKTGLVGGLPSNLKSAHKFGESGDPTEKHFSESAIIYLDNNPYILTVMLKGKSYDKLPEIIRQISATVYQNMSGTTKTAS